MGRASREPRYAEPPSNQPPEPRVSGRAMAAPRSPAEALAYLVTLLALYGGVIAVIALDAAGPTCSGATCSTFHPGIRPAAVVAAVGFVALIVLAFHLTRGYDRRTREPGNTRRPSARGWPLTWNYLAAGLVLPEAIRALGGRADGESRAGDPADRT